MDIRNNIQKQYSSVRGSKIKCINYQGCAVCYGCRAYDGRDPECIECLKEDNLRGKKYNICNKELHETWKVNKIVSKTKINIDNVSFISKGEE